VCQPDPELVDQVGPELARYARLRVPVGESTNLSAGLLARHTEENPAFRVRFAHARLAALARQANALGVHPGDRYERLTHPREAALIRTLGEFTAVIDAPPYRVIRYLERLADDLNQVEMDCRVLPMGDEPTTDLHRARLALAAATLQVLADGLKSLGLTAPDRL
jgi:arginyl-tRNA synthetase